MATSPEEVLQSKQYRDWVHYAYVTHTRAVAHFIREGITEVRVVPRYSPSAVRDHLQKIMSMHAPAVKVMDMTAKMPTTASGSLLPAIQMLIRCRQSAAQNPNIMWYVQRTPDNTPGFVHLFAYGNQVATPQSTGGALLDAAYCGVAFFRGLEITLPARLAVASGETAAEAIAAFAGVGYDGFKCEICHETFAKFHVIDGVPARAIDDMIISDCDHCFHPQCMIRRVSKGHSDASKCPACNTQLPYSLHTERNDVEVARQAGKRGRPSHYLGPHSAQISAAGAASDADDYMAAVRAQYNATCLQKTGVPVQVVELEERLSSMPFPE